MENQPQNREMLSRILSGEEIWVSLYENISYRDLTLNPDSIWSFLLYTGYLKVIEKRKNIFDEWEYRVAIPNQEIRSVMRSAARHWWQDIYVRGYDARPLMDALSMGNAKQAEKEINIILSRGISCFDYKEAFYHGTLYGLLQTQTSDIKSNTEFGNGRPDIVALWKTQAIVIECKRVSSADLDAMKRKINDEIAELCDIEDACMEQKLSEGEKQIKDRSYLRGVQLAFPAADEILCYVVAFYGKRCMMRKIG
jgi:hypothetical protein